MATKNDFSKQSIPGHRLLYLESVTSTNEFMSLIVEKNAAENGLIVVTDKQTAGNGIHGSKWESEDYKNLTFSLLTGFNNLDVSEQFYISKCISIAAYKFIDQLAERPIARLKWPNDIYINGKKVAGILLKNTLLKNSIRQCCIGVGLNVNQQNFLISGATSLKNELKFSFDLPVLLQKIVQSIDMELRKLVKKEFAIIDKLYFERLIGCDRHLLYRDLDNRIIEAIIVAVPLNGHLILQLKNGERREYDLKEISLIPAGTDGQPTY
ncbi:MAG: biotin--[acetyl-CoA-carboxylase] ligase [Vicingaceae bacterium]